MNYFYDILPDDLQIYIKQISNVSKIQQKFKEIEIKKKSVNTLAIDLISKMTNNFLELSVKNIKNIVEKIQFINKSCKNNFIKIEKNTCIKLLHKIISALEMEEYVFAHPNHMKFIFKTEIAFMEIIKKKYNLKYIDFSNILLIDETTLLEIYQDIPEEIVSNDFLSNLIISNSTIEYRY